MYGSKMICSCFDTGHMVRSLVSFNLSYTQAARSLSQKHAQVLGTDEILFDIDS